MGQADHKPSKGRVIHFPASESTPSLVIRAGRGDMQAQTNLYRSHAPDFLGFLYRLCGNTHDAEDIAQEAFLTTFQRIKAVQPDRFRAYLYGVGVRKCQHLFRRRGLLRRLGFAPMIDEASIRSIAAPGTTPEQVAELKRVFGFLSTMPSSQRLAWSLRKIEGFTIDETASFCRCSAATVKRRVDAVETRLSAHLKESSHADH